MLVALFAVRNRFSGSGQGRSTRAVLPGLVMLDTQRASLWRRIRALGDCARRGVVAHRAHGVALRYRAHTLETQSRSPVRTAQRNGTPAVALLARVSAAAGDYTLHQTVAVGAVTFARQAPAAVTTVQTLRPVRTTQNEWRRHPARGHAALPERAAVLGTRLVHAPGARAQLAARATRGAVLLLLLGRHRSARPDLLVSAPAPNTARRSTHGHLKPLCVPSPMRVSHPGNTTRTRHRKSRVT